MRATKILQSVGLNPQDYILAVDNEDAVENILEFIKEWDLKIRIEKVSKKEWKMFFDFYAESIIFCDPDKGHQERWAFLRSESIWRK